MTVTSFDTTSAGSYMHAQAQPIERATFAGLSDEDRAVLLDLIGRLNAKRSRNELRRRYYDQHNALKDLGISIPPTLKSVEVVAGWPAKAVDVMSRRTILGGFKPSGSTELDAIVRQVWDDNHLDADAPAAHTSALIHSCAFGFTHLGDESAGEPPVLITVRSAEDATGIWSRRRRTITDALSVSEVDVKTGQPTVMNLYREGRVITLTRAREGVFDSFETWHGMGVPVELLPFKADLNRPFGRSRITRAVMYNTDAAIRTMLRTEVGAEFYNAPQRYALGAEDDAFEDKDGNAIPAWSVMLGRLLTLSRDENGDLPTLGQFAQQTMQPNIDQLRMIAQMQASEVSLPVSELGIVQDNPESAQAIRGRLESLGSEIRHWQRTALGPAWRRMFIRAVAMATDSPEALAAARGLVPDWEPWAEQDELVAAQASQLRISAIPALAETDVELERMGYTNDQIERVQAQMRRSRASQMTAALTQAAQGAVAV